MAYNLTASEVYDDFAFRLDGYDDAEPAVCVCADHIGTTQVAYCEACADWTDAIERDLDEMDAATAAPRKPAAVAGVRIAEVA